MHIWITGNGHSIAKLKPVIKWTRSYVGFLKSSHIHYISVPYYSCSYRLHIITLFFIGVCPMIMIANLNKIELNRVMIYVTETHVVLNRFRWANCCNLQFSFNERVQHKRWGLAVQVTACTKKTDQSKIKATSLMVKQQIESNLNT